MFTNELQKNVYRKRIVNAEFLLCRTDGVPSMRLVHRSTQLCTKCVVPLQLAPMHISMVLECFSNWWCGFCVCLCLVFHAASCAHTCASGKIHTLRFANGCCCVLLRCCCYTILCAVIPDKTSTRAEHTHQHMALMTRSGENLRLLRMVSVMMRTLSERP